jgi:predicted nucleic acid-binding protein
VKTWLLDTNLLIRILTGEPEAQARRAGHLLERCENGECVLRLTSLVVAEAVFVLTGKVHGIPRNDTADALIGFLESPSLEVEDRETLLKALALFRDHPIDFVDAWLAARAQVLESGIASFDQDFKRLPGVQLVDF